MRIKLLDRLLVEEVLQPFAFAISLFTTILVAITELQPLTSMVVEHHVPLQIAAQIFVLSLPKFISLALPMAMLLATMLAAGNLSGGSETTAMQAAGVSIYRMALPIGIVGILVSLLAIVFNEAIAPQATARQNAIYDAAIRSGMPSNRAFHYEQITNGHRVFVLDADNYDSETKRLIHPTLVYFGDNGKPKAVQWASWGQWDGSKTWVLNNGFLQAISDNPTADTSTVPFQTYTMTTGVSIQEMLMANTDPDALSYSQLKSRIERKLREKHTAADIDPDMVKLDSKISIPFAAVIFALVGFPLGIRKQRSGPAMGYAISVAIIFVYYLIYTYASILGNNGAVPAWVSAWLPNVLGLIGGGVVLRRTSG